MIAYLDCSTGVSGDKFLGALIGAGFDPAVLVDALRSMGLGDIAVDVQRRSSSGVAAIGVAVSEADAPRRHWRELRTLLEDAESVPPAVRATALRALHALADAEAQVHGVSADDVHFHEIGAADTIADVLGVALALESLDIGELYASPVAVGSGTVSTEHGELPVPAPATALLLRGLPVMSGTAAGELTTPTGAALVATLATGFGDVPAMTLRRVGTGCGTRSIGMPNICRLLVGEPVLAEPGHEDVVVLEANLDHLTPEELAVAADRLRESGALDVWQTPIVMKKGRAAVLLSVLCPAGAAPAVADLFIAETGTLGVRVLPASRRVVPRDVAEIETSLGTARFKTAWLPGVGQVLRVESDDAARIAADRGIAVGEAARILEVDASRATGTRPLRERDLADEGVPPK